MSELVAFVLIALAFGTGLVMLPWVGFMAVFVALAFAGILIGHFWSRYYLDPAARVSLKVLDAPAVKELLPAGSWRLALVALALWAVAILVVPGLVGVVVLPVFIGDPEVHFGGGMLAGVLLTGMTAVLHPMCPISGCEE